MLAYLIWGILGAAIFDCVIRSCDLFGWFIDEQEGFQLACGHRLKLWKVDHLFNSYSYLSGSVSIGSPCAYLRPGIRGWTLLIFSQNISDIGDKEQRFGVQHGAFLTVNALISYFTGDISLPSLLGGCRSLNKP